MPKLDNGNLRVPYALAVHGHEEKKRVLAVLDEHRTNTGKETYEFEERSTKYFGKKYATIVQSPTRLWKEVLLLDVTMEWTSDTLKSLKKSLPHTSRSTNNSDNSKRNLIRVWGEPAIPGTTERFWRVLL